MIRNRLGKLTGTKQTSLFLWGPWTPHTIYDPFIFRILLFERSPHGYVCEELMEAMVAESASVRWRWVFTEERKVSAGTIGLQRSSRCRKWDDICVKSVEKVIRILRVKLSHPYIGVCENNHLSEVRRCLMRRLLEDTCTVSDARRRALLEQNVFNNKP